MKKTFMWYYSVVILTFSMLIVFFDLITGVDVEESFWALAIYMPILIWLSVTGE